MTLKFNSFDQLITTNQIKNFSDDDTFDFFVENTENESGSKTVSMFVDSRQNEEGFICIELNKNNALYLLNFLNAFLQEKDIDPLEKD
jgi:hypothetical protein